MKLRPMYPICNNSKVCFFSFCSFLYVLSCHCMCWYLGWWKVAFWKLYDLLGSLAVVLISCKDINSHLLMKLSRSYRVTSSGAWRGGSEVPFSLPKCGWR